MCWTSGPGFSYSIFFMLQVFLQFLCLMLNNFSLTVSKHNICQNFQNNSQIKNCDVEQTNCFSTILYTFTQFQVAWICTTGEDLCNKYWGEHPCYELCSKLEVKICAINCAAKVLRWIEVELLAKHYSWCMHNFIMMIPKQFTNHNHAKKY